MSATEVLRKLEWSGTSRYQDDAVSCCPVCHLIRIGERHASDCALAAALADGDEVERLRDAYALLDGVSWSDMDLPQGEYFHVIRLIGGWLDTRGGRRALDGGREET